MSVQEQHELRHVGVVNEHGLVRIMDIAEDEAMTAFDLDQAAAQPDLWWVSHGRAPSARVRSEEYRKQESYAQPNVADYQVYRVMQQASRVVRFGCA